MTRVDELTVISIRIHFSQRLLEIWICPVEQSSCCLCQLQYSSVRRFLFIDLCVRVTLMGTSLHSLDLCLEVSLASLKWCPCLRAMELAQNHSLIFSWLGLSSWCSQGVTSLYSWEWFVILLRLPCVFVARCSHGWKGNAKQSRSSRVQQWWLRRKPAGGIWEGYL